MSDESVHTALRSDAPLVLVEAPAGCGKTHQGADFARDVAADRSNRLLILTHTHAACSVFAERTRGSGSRVEIHTIDSLIAHIATAYHLGLGLPADVPTWARRTPDGYRHVALRVVALLRRHPMIAATLAKRYPVVICDEHRDCSGDQHALGIAMLNQGARLRVFADPVQRIFKESPLAGSTPAQDWVALTKQAHAFEELDTPHRWRSGCPDLGRWTLLARAALKNGGKIDIRNNLPASVSVVVAENQARRNMEYQLAPADRRAIDAFTRSHTSLLVLTRYNETARSLRAFFNRRLPLWEGHTRSALEKLVDAITTGNADCPKLATAVVTFMNDVGKGFSPSAFGDRFEKEVREGCTARSRGKPATIQELGRFLLAEPDHRGVAKLLARLAALKQGDADFADIEMDHSREFWEAVKLGNFEDLDAGLAEITHRRTYGRPKPPDAAISTIHKAKGLECGNVVVMPCDAKTFPDREDARCLLYVALSRAKERLMLVVSRASPSPLFQF
jgi:DNA helicase-2/ATP-dependent DNA helicase PcrA